LTEPIQGYSDALDADKQVTMEERIATIIDDYQDNLLAQERLDDRAFGEEDTAELGRRILLAVLAEFRPDLFEPTLTEGGLATEAVECVNCGVSFLPGEDTSAACRKVNEVWEDHELRPMTAERKTVLLALGGDERPRLPEGWPGLLTGHYYVTDLATGERVPDQMTLVRGQLVTHTPVTDAEVAAHSNAARREFPDDTRRWLPEVRDVPPGFRLIYHVFGDEADDWYGELVVAYRAFEELLKAGHARARLNYEIEALPLTGEHEEEGVIEAVGDFPT
jgi:hypothetical protein